MKLNRILNRFTTSDIGYHIKFHQNWSHMMNTAICREVDMKAMGKVLLSCALVIKGHTTKMYGKWKYNYTIIILIVSFTSSVLPLGNIPCTHCI
jgi:hypothetical protein